MKLIDLINVSKAIQLIKVLFKSHGITAHATMLAARFFDSADEELLNMQVVDLWLEDGAVVVKLKGEER